MDVPMPILADAMRIRQIVLNLLTNAVKFTDAGGEVHLTVEPHLSEVVIRVTDTGSGIAPTGCRRFSTCSRPVTRRAAGWASGLRL
jgi:K+-sensing histidine kinase KdpD